MKEPSNAFPPFEPKRQGFSRQPIWNQIRDYIIGCLGKGVWEAGDMLPSEKELSVALGVASGTVRRALDSLVEDGILSRIQGRGTFVKSFKSHGYTNPFHRFFFDKTNSIVPFEMRVVRYETVPVTHAVVPARILNLAYDQTLIHALRVFSWEGRDVGISELWLDSRRFSKMTKANLANRSSSLYSYYESELGVSVVSVSDTIKAKIFDETLASLGNFKVGALYLELTRIGRTFEDVPVEYRLSYCLSDDFHMVFGA